MWDLHAKSFLYIICCFFWYEEWFRTLMYWMLKRSNSYYTLSYYTETIRHSYAHGKPKGRKTKTKLMQPSNCGDKKCKEGYPLLLLFKHYISSLFVFPFSIHIACSKSVNNRQSWWKMENCYRLLSIPELPYMLTDLKIPCFCYIKNLIGFLISQAEFWRYLADRITFLQMI